MIRKDNYIELFVIIADRKKKTSLLEAVARVGGRVVLSEYGKGSANVSAFVDAFGFAPEEHKVVIFCLLVNTKADALLEILNNEFQFKEPNTGIAYTVKLEGLSF